MTAKKKNPVRKVRKGVEHPNGDVRITKSQASYHRASIRVSCILTQLHKNTMGLLKSPNTGEPYYMKPSQVKSAEVLLNKALPTLQSVDVTNHSEVPDMSPEELKQELGKFLRALPREEAERLLNGTPELTVIEGEVVK